MNNTRVYLTSTVNRFRTLSGGRVFAAGSGWKYRPNRINFRPLSFLAVLFSFLAVVLVSSPSLAAEWATTDTGTTQHLRGGWIAPDGTVFAVGDGGTILRFDGTA